MIYEDALREIIVLSNELERRKTANKLVLYYPEDDMPGYPARSKYPKHMEMFARGSEEGVIARLFLAANGVGKTELALFEACCHLRGWYPDWWVGRRFDRPVDIWIAGKTSESVRDIQQMKMLGKPYEEGTGMLPKEWIDIGSITRIGVPGAVGTIRVKRADGRFSYIGFKSYHQGVQSFYGPEKDAVLLDEPPPVDIYSECVARTRNREGAFLLVTMAPKEGNTETVRLFLDEPHPSRVVVNCGWADVPHLTDEWKTQMRASTPPYLLDATEFGLPGRGAGAVYPVKESEIVVEPLPIPSHWRWMWGIDGGFHNTAVGWFAYDEDQDVLYLVAEYKEGGEGTDLGMHAMRIAARNRALGYPDMPGVGDVAAISVIDGKKMLDQYHTYGLNLVLADKAVNAGISELLSRMRTGRFKVFSTCVKWLQEFRAYSYRQSKDGANPTIVKLNDHLMDMTRYVAMKARTSSKPKKKPSGQIFKRLEFV